MRTGRAASVLTIAFVAAGLLIGGWLGLRHMRGLGSALDRLEYLTLDWRFLLAGGRPAPNDVALVLIDDRTLAETDGHVLSRETLAHIAAAIAASSPRVVAIDLAFPDSRGAPADTALAEALKTSRSVVASIGIFGGRGRLEAPPQPVELALAPRPSEVLWPIEIIQKAAETGLANISTDASGVPRYVPLLFETSEGVALSFALAVAAAATDAEPVFRPDEVEIAGRTIDTDLGYHLPIRYYGPAGGFRRYSAASVLHGEIDPGRLRDKVIVVGAIASGLGDTFATPFDRIAPGAEIFATAIGNLLAGETLKRTESTRRIDAATTALLPAALVALISMRRAFVGLVLAAVLLALWTAGVFLAFVGGYWLAVAPPLAVAAPLVALYTAARFLLERQAGQKAAQATASLAKFQSPVFVDQILRDPRFLERPVAADIAVMFMDLTGSTRVTEAIGPERSRDLLHTMQTLVEGEVTAHGGVVINYMGDGVLAVFGLPKSNSADAARAFAAVEALNRRLAAWLAGQLPRVRDRLDFRIGLHFGPAVISRLGSPTHQQISAAGDTVNVASRLLEVAKQERCRIVVSDDVFRAVAAVPTEIDASLYTPLTVPIRGRVNSLGVRIRS